MTFLCPKKFVLINEFSLKNSNSLELQNGKWTKAILMEKANKVKINFYLKTTRRYHAVYEIL